MDIKSIFRSIVGLSNNDMKVNATSNVNGDGNLVVQNSPYARVISISDPKLGGLLQLIGSQNTDLLCSIDIKNTGFINNELPEPSSPRTEVVNSLQELLFEHKVLSLYGGFLSGKTVLCYLIAARFEDYNVITLNGRYISAKEISFVLNSLNTSNGNLLVIVDHVKIDGNNIDLILSAIRNFRCSNKLIIINSSNSLATFEPCEDIPEIQIPLMCYEDVCAMIPENVPEKNKRFIYSLCAGQPFVTRLACFWLKLNNWELDTATFEKVFGIHQSDNVKTRVYSALKELITDSEDLHLLNRLLVFPREFSKEDCLSMADQLPQINIPSTRLSQLIGSWVESLGNNKYRVIDILHRSIDPDLNKVELKNCCDIAISKILAKVELTPTDVHDALLLMLKARDWKRYACFYTSVITKLAEEKLIEHPNTKLLMSIWTDMPLPTAMSADDKVMMRMVRLINDPNLPTAPALLAEDLYQLLPAVAHNDIMAYAVSVILEIYYAFNINIKRLININSIKRSLNLSNLGEEIQKTLSEIRMPAGIPMVCLNGITSFNEFENWIRLYAEYGFPEDECLGIGISVCLPRLCNSLTVEEQLLQLERMYNVCNEYKPNTAVIASYVTALEIHLLGCGNIHKVQNLYKERDWILDSTIGRFLLNACVGLCYYDLGIEQSIDKLYIAIQSPDIIQRPQLAVRCACYYAQLKAKDDAESAANAINMISDKIMVLLSEEEQFQLLLSRAYALCRCDKIEKAISILIIAFDKLLSLPRDNNFKVASLHYGVIILFLYAKLHPEIATKNFAEPSYVSVFIVPDKTEELYNPQRIFTCLCYLCELNDYYNGDYAVTRNLICKILYIFPEFAGDHSEYLLLVSQAIPMLLKNGEYDLCDQLIDHIVKALHAHPDIDGRNGLVLIVKGYALYSVLDWLYREFKGICIPAGKANTIIKKIPSVIPHNESDDVLAFLIESLENYHSKSPMDIAILVYELHEFCDVLWSWPSARRILCDQARELMENCAVQRPEAFNCRYSSLMQTFNRISPECFGTKLYLKRLLQGYDFHLINPHYPIQGISSLLSED